ncbi:hypothetical protein [Paracoccus marcusii]|uniref:hypothetical protein n=1 Tax=Paracoccus marcusii TaxID=59779 RepID=UPI002492D87D|nr:hypothetical protein [Paracoccus marcusii]
MPKPRLPTDPPGEMPTARPADPITRKAQIDARLQALSARTELQARKDHDRLTWILGRMVVEQMTHDPALQAWVRRDLPRHLTPRDQDRGLWQILFPDDAKD